MNALYTLVYMVFTGLIWIVVIWAIASWLIAFNVINNRNQFVYSLMRGIEGLLEPMLRPIRRILPMAGGVDFSPMVLLIILYVLRVFILNDIFPWLFGPRAYIG